jgi:hypothetical protein
MESDNFYEFGDSDSNSTFQASLVKSQKNISLDNQDFEQDRLQWGDYSKSIFPAVFEYYRGRALKDMLGTGWTSLYLISDRMKEVLEEHNLTGWKTFPIKLFGKKGEEISGYHGFSVTGRGGCIDHSGAVMIEKEAIPGPGIWKYYKGMTVDLTKWDNTDFFKPENYSGTIVTEKAAMALKEAHITNVKLTKLTDIEISESSYTWHISKQKTH